MAVYADDACQHHQAQYMFISSKGCRRQVCGATLFMQLRQQFHHGTAMPDPESVDDLPVDIAEVCGDAAA